MTAKEFMSGVTRDGDNILARFLALLETCGAPYCVIRGLAVNAYAEPLISLDLDVVVTVTSVEALCSDAANAGFLVERFEHSVNLASPGSDIRIQLQRDPRYQAFLSRGEAHELLGYTMVVARVDDVLQGKIWAYEDATRRASKRQKDLADIARLIETYPKLRELVPASIQARLG